jgi:Uma2 family endonuclease
MKCYRKKDKRMAVKVQSTIQALYTVSDKAEIVNGELQIMSPTGGAPGYAGDEIFASLRNYAKRKKKGRAVSDNKAFRVNLPNRASFSPDAALYVGPDPGMKFYEGAPVFAVEVRSEGDYGPIAERAMAAKRYDYFVAGTLVVWDVDLLSRDVIKVYRATNPEIPTIYRHSDIAEAEPAVPGWRMPVADLFPQE